MSEANIFYVRGASQLLGSRWDLNAGA